MKIVFKYISFIVVTFITIILILNKDKVILMAATKNVGDIRIGDVFKVGDVIPYDIGFNRCNLGEDIFCDHYTNRILFAFEDRDNNYVNEFFYSREDDEGNINNINIVFEDNYSEYWILSNAFFGSLAVLLFNPYDYKEPTFDITCNPSSVKPNEISQCSLNVKYHLRMENINFKLNAGDFNISNVMTGESFENLVLNNGVYSLTTKDTVIDSDSEIETTLVTFNVFSNEEKSINVLNNVNAIDISYTDKIESNVVDNISATVIQEYDVPTSSDDVIATGSDDRPDSNPKTGNANFMIIYSFVVLFVSLSIFFVVYRYENTEL